MKAFFLLSLIAAVYGVPSMIRPAILAEEPMQPIIIPVNPLDMTRPLPPNPDHLINSAIIGEITRPTNMDTAIPSLDIPSIIELPAEIAPLVQIIVNIKKEEKVESVAPQVPEPEFLPVVPLVPMIPEEEKPSFGVFPLLPEMTRPSEQGINPDFMKPAIQAPIQSLELPINSMLDRPATSLIR